MRLIDADALYAKCKSRLKEAFESEDGEAYITAYNMMVDLENAPTIEARPVVRGECETTLQRHCLEESRKRQKR